MAGPALSEGAKGHKLLTRCGLVGLEEGSPGRIVAAKPGSGVSDSKHRVPGGSSHLTQPRREPPSPPSPGVLPAGCDTSHNQPLRNRNGGDFSGVHLPGMEVLEVDTRGLQTCSALALQLVFLANLFLTGRS